MARIESVNIGSRQTAANQTGSTGIHKLPVDGIEIGTLGVAGDYVADRRHHGGPDQAVYVYFADDYDWWEAALGRALPAGTFGENVTISGLSSADIAIGDRLVAGDVVLEATAPRIPCGTLAARMGDPGFVKAYRDAERPGVYCRVVVPGRLRPGTPVGHVPYAGPRIGSVPLFRDCFALRKLPPARMREVLAAPVAERIRAEWEHVLDRVG